MNANEADRKPTSVHSRTSTRAAAEEIHEPPPRLRRSCHHRAFAGAATTAPSPEQPPPQRIQTMTAATSLHETLTQQPREEGGVNPNFGETLCATCQPLIAQSNWSNLVN